MAPGFAFCGLDRSRAPLTGDEIRPCWTPAALDHATDDDADAAELARRTARTPVRSSRDFVLVEARSTTAGSAGPDTPLDGPSTAEVAPVGIPVGPAQTDAWSLFPELEG